MDKFYKFLDEKVLPWPVRFLTNPLVILITFILLIPLIVFGDAVVFVLIVNSYMNVTSVGVSSIVLRQTLLAADAQEKRDQETHDAVIESLSMIKKELALVQEELSIAKEERDMIKKLLEKEHLQ